MNHPRWLLASVLALLVAAIPAGVSARPAPAGAGRIRTFALGPASPAIAACLPGARATVSVVPNAQNETLTLHASGLPAFAGFDLYLTALPHPPFGIAWPLGLLHADVQGAADLQVQTALLQASAIGGSPNPATHLVLFFDDPRDADPCFGAGGAQTTPYNTNHQGGPAALASVGYADAAGPLQAPALGRPGLGFNIPAAGHSSPGRAVTFTSTCSHPDGWTAIRFIDFRLTQGRVARFWARLDRLAKRIYLYDPATRRWAGGYAPGSKAILSTPLTQLIVTDSVVIGSAGTTGKVVWSVAFSTAASGQTFQQDVRVTDLRNQSSGWNPTGSWKVD